MDDIYGGFSLQRKDSDTNQVWGGEKRIAVANHVVELQQDLKELGFRIVGESSDGVFGRNAEWAVREFQIYAKMEFVARDIAKEKASLSSIPDYLRLVEQKNDDRYSGAVSGVVNLETAKRIKAWKEKGWRCPAIACAFEISSNERTATVKASNLWAGDESYAKPARVYVRDFTRYYCQLGEAPTQVQLLWVDPASAGTFKLKFGGNTIDVSDRTVASLQTALNSLGNFKVIGTDNSPWEIRFIDRPTVGTAEILTVEGIPTDAFHLATVPEWLVVGDYAKYSNLGGPRSLPPNHCPSQYGGELLPETLIGKTAAEVDNSPTLKSTYRVVRAVSEVECLGFFDSLNAYDTGLISLGPCHWILGLKSKEAISAGELGSFLSYLKNKSEASFEKVIGQFGVQAIDRWDTAPGNGAKLFNKSLRTYTTWLQLQTETGLAPLPKTWREASWFKTWHWFYRFAMAGRTQFADGTAAPKTNSLLAGYRLAMWDMARIRLRNILTAEWPKINDKTLRYEPEDRNARIGDVFTSELATALLLRWHINVPGTLLKNGKASKHLINILRQVDDGDIDGLVARIDTDDAQATLTRQLIDYVKSDTGPLTSSPAAKNNLIKTLEEIQNWPGEQTARQKRGYRLKQDSGDTNLDNLIREKLSTAKRSFSFYKEGIDVAELPISPQKVQYAAIPISKPVPTDRPSFFRFGVALLTKLFDFDDSQELAAILPINELALTLFAPPLPPNEAIPDDDPSLDGLPQPIVQEQPLFLSFKFPVTKIEGRDLQPADLVTDINSLSDQDFILFNETEDPHNQSSEIVSLSGDIDIGKQVWQLDLSSLADFLGFKPEIKVILENGQVRLDVTVDDQKVSLPRPFNWSFAAANGLDTAQWTTFEFYISDRSDLESGLEVAHIKFDITDKTLPLDYGLPFLLTGKMSGTLDLEVTLDRKWQLIPKLELTVAIEGDSRIDLGSPIAQLSLPNGGFKIEFDPSGGLRFILNEDIQPKLHLDLFEKFGDQNVVVNNIWSREEGQEEEQLLTLPLSQLTGLSEEVRTITWQNSFSTVSQELMNHLLGNLNDIAVQTRRRLQSLAGGVLGAVTPTQVTFDKCSTNSFEFTPGELKVCLKLKVADQNEQKTILEGEGKFVFLYDVKDNRAIFSPGAFRCTGESLIRSKTSFNSSFSEIISLHIPGETAFEFICDPKDPKLKYKPAQPQKDGVPSRITIRVPAAPDDKPKDSTFTFELEEFALHSAGFNLKGAIRSEKVRFEDFFAEPLAVKSPERNNSSNGGTPTTGWLEFKNSTLVKGSLQASAKLKYFDDATGIFTLALAQDPASKQLDAAGSLEVSGLSEFHIDRLYMACQIAMFHLGVKYLAGQWSVDAWMTGRIKFAPPRGQSAGNMKELSDLFGGVECGFEKLDPLKLGNRKVEVTFPVKRFEFANVFDIDLQGVSFEPTATLKDKLMLLGNITIKQLPGVEASLRFGNITLIDGNPPTFTVDRIGAQFSVPGGFRLDGDFEFIEFETESGFVGAFAVTTETLPRIAGLLKVTRVRTRDHQAWVPSIAVYLEADIDVALFAGFFLRSIGVGLGIYQALAGLEPDNSRPLPQKIIKLVDSPTGLPQPRRPEAWKPAAPERVNSGLNWMFVASGLLTLGKLKNDQPHSLAASILLALDQDLQLVVGVNIWLFASPQDTQSKDFAYRPVGRGAVGLSVKEKRLFATFRTLKNPKLRNDAPPILKEVLSKVETSLLFSADQKGMLIEVGWPWETRIKGHALGELIKGEMISGFRFGIYQGVISFGLNYAVTVVLEAERRIGFDTKLGSAEAYLSAKGTGTFRASFVGALDQSFRVYLLGDVRINATLALTAQASASLSIRITRWFKIELSISFKTTINISISAALTAAMEPGPNIGFEGEAEVAISVSGFRLAGRLTFTYRREAITSTKNNIERLLPPRLDNQTLAVPQQLASIEDLPQGWNYRFTKVKNNAAVRVLLFPKPGTLYPLPAVPKILSKNDSRVILTDFNTDFSVLSILNLLETSPIDLISLKTLLQPHLNLPSEIKGVNTLNQDILAPLGAIKGWRVGSDNDVAEQDYLLIPFEETVIPSSLLFSIANTDAAAIVNALPSGDLPAITAILKPFFDSNSKSLPDLIDGINSLKSETITALVGQQGWRIGSDATLSDRDYALILMSDGSLNVYFNPERLRTVVSVFLNPQRPRFALKLNNPGLFKGFVGNKKVDPINNQLFWGEELDRELSPSDSPKDEKFYLCDVLRSLDQESGKTHFQGTTEISDPRPLNPSPEHTDDETTSVATARVNSPNLTRDTEYDRNLSDAWQEPQAPSSFLVLYKDSADKINQAREKLIALAQSQAQSQTEIEPPSELSALFAGQTEQLPNKIFVIQLTDSAVEPFQAQAVWQVDPGIDETPDGNGFVRGYYILQIEEGLKVIANYYNESQVQEPLSPGMLLAELLELMADETALVDTALLDQGNDEGFAPYLNLVLEFELTNDLKNKFDPIPQLIDLEQGIRIEETQQPLESLLGKGVEPPEYDLVAGPVHQSNEQICLTWLFLREDLAQPQLEVNPQGSTNRFAAYTELERFVIIRRNFSILSDEPREIAIYPSWIQGETGLIRPQFQFVDEQLENVSEGNQLQYEVIAKACDRILASCLINTIRQTVRPLPPLGQALALHDLNSAEPSIEIVVAVESVAQEKFKLTDELVRELKPILRKNFTDDITDDVIDGLINKLNSLIDQTFDRETQFRKKLKELMSLGELARFEKYILAQARFTDFGLLFPSDELRLHYRLTQAKTVGSYGFESRPEVTTQWSNGLPSRDRDSNFPQIEFASVRGSYQLPWEEIADLPGGLASIEWEPLELKVTPAGEPPEYGYRKRFTEKQLREALAKWRDGTAIEFYVGRERANQQPRNTIKPIERSPLLKCRHAIIPVTSTPLTDDSSSNSLDLGQGNFVEALEYLPEDEPQLVEWLNLKRVIEHQIDYPVDEPDKDEQKTFSLTLAWRHDLSGRRGYDDPMLLGYDDPSADTPGLQKRFDPVIGYRLYRHDAYDPNPFPSNAEVFIRVIPDLLYRAQPASIEVLGLADKPDPTVSRPRQPTNLDEATIDRLDYGLTAPVADWIPTQEGAGDLKTETLTDVPVDTLAPVPFTQPEKLPGGRVWLHKEIQGFITKLEVKLQELQGGAVIEAVIGLDNPLELKAEQSVTDELLISELQTLQTELNGKTDPYGWRTAEAFGLSCECRFQTSTEQFIPTGTVINAIEEIKNDLPLVSVGIFFAEDDKTPLNVIRLVYARKIRDWQELKRAFDLDIAFADRYLGTQVINNQYNHRILTEQRQRLLDDKSGLNLKQWLNDLNTRLSASKLIDEDETRAISHLTFFRYDARTSQTESKADNLPPQAVVALPISREGRIEHRLSIPDRWAHQYEISLELVRRYDRARGHTFGGLPQSEHRIAIDIMRSQELVPHNLLATPLNGGIQAIVFRHPAAFAAAASAVQAAHIQYSGQTVHLERRIDPDALDALKVLYNRFTEKNPAIDWQVYQRWLSESGKEGVTPGPKLYNPDGTIAKPKTLDPLQPVEEGTLPAIYGADRYVFPDLPGYYQYRVVAYSTAGRRHSEPKATPWISPLYEAGDDARQRPVAEPCNLADYKASQKTLKLRIPLIHPRQHLLEAIRGLWVDADDWFEINATPAPAIALRFGSLPDLYLTYQLYLWINQDAGDGATRVYLPLLKIKPPSIDNAGIWFTVESQATGLKLATDPATSTEKFIITQVEGQLVFEIDLDLNDPKCQPLLEALNALRTTDVKEIVSLAVQRGGVWSKLQPPFL
jgi:hypothetical protein